MKIRIKDNSVRIRLTQGELHLLETEGSLQSKTIFPGEQQFIYGLKIDASVDQCEGIFHNGEMWVLLPKAVAEKWIGTDQVGIEAQQMVKKGNRLNLLVEKDFKCLHPGERREDETDHFPHPMEQLE